MINCILLHPNYRILLCWRIQPKWLWQPLGNLNTLLQWQWQWHRNILMYAITNSHSLITKIIAFHHLDFFESHWNCCVLLFWYNGTTAMAMISPSSRRSNPLAKQCYGIHFNDRASSVFILYSHQSVCIRSAACNHCQTWSYFSSWWSFPMMRWDSAIAFLDPSALAADRVTSCSRSSMSDITGCFHPSRRQLEA